MDKKEKAAERAFNRYGKNHLARHDRLTKLGFGSMDILELVFLFEEELKALHNIKGSENAEDRHEIPFAPPL